MYVEADLPLTVLGARLASIMLPGIVNLQTISKLK